MHRNATLDQRLARDGKSSSIFRDLVVGVAGETAAIAPGVPVTEITLAGATQNDFTLADAPHEGMRKLAFCSTKASTGNGVVTPDNLWGGTTLTFDGAGDTIELVFLKGKWAIVGGTAALA